MFSFSKSFRPIALTIPLFSVAACQAPSSLEPNPEFVPLPTLGSGEEIVLRYAFIENPDVPTFTLEEWQIVLDTASEAVDEHFGLNVQFAGGESIDLEETFSRLDVLMTEEQKGQIAPMNTAEIDWHRMVEAIEETLPETNLELIAALNYLERYAGRDLGPIRGNTISERRRSLAVLASLQLAEALDNMAHNLEWELTGDPQRVSEFGYNEWVYWDALPSLGMPYEVLLTNQAVVSVEYAPYPLHIITRAGVTAGTTSGNPTARFGTSSWVTSFPFIDLSPNFGDLRGASYWREDSARYAGLLLAHEHA